MQPSLGSSLAHLLSSELLVMSENALEIWMLLKAQQLQPMPPY